MAEPIPGLNVKFSTKAYELLYVEGSNVYIAPDDIKLVTNLEYETKINDEKRQILVLKPEYLGAFIGDVKNMMNYDTSSQFIDKKTKRVYNSRLK
jgi:hypothetical protein